jgi:hypothetical protein
MSAKTGFRLFLVIFVLCIIGYPTFYYVSADTIEITVKDKERVVDGSSDNMNSRYLIYTTDEVFENVDALLFLKYNSSDVYGKLEVGKTYTVKVAGWRVKFFSWYRNIIRVKN